MAKAKKASAPKKAAVTKTPKAKPLPEGEVEQFPKHAYRADMGEGLPAQAPPATGTDKGK